MGGAEYRPSQCVIRTWSHMTKTAGIYVRMINPPAAEEFQHQADCFHLITVTDIIIQVIKV